MIIQPGQKLPKAVLREKTADGVQDVPTESLFAGRKIVVFGLPGAFTPTCSSKHLPGFVEKADEIKAKGVDEIICLSVNDAFVMDAWGREREVGGKIRMLADGSCDFTEKAGLVWDATERGMGRRSKRYAMIVEDGTVTHLVVDDPGKFEGSSAEAILQALG
ncbi:peroxiredoxin [Telmatospirillum sp. J64-1]|uniref:peroxiredoxin n=1 Tax=Telmatospirillum sp. J64-1 TaxID=2502183 RepID=UPI00115CAF92|nr:peroxiredoxin [Telmatospirillum sp. J64-1]